MLVGTYKRKLAPCVHKRQKTAKQRKARVDWKSMTSCHTMQHATLTEQNGRNSGGQADNFNGDRVGGESAPERPYQSDAKPANPQDVHLQLPFDGKCETWKYSSTCMCTRAIIQVLVAQIWHPGLLRLFYVAIPSLPPPYNRQ